MSCNTVWGCLGFRPGGENQPVGDGVDEDLLHIHQGHVRSRPRSRATDFAMAVTARVARGLAPENVGAAPGGADEGYRI